MGHWISNGRKLSPVILGQHLAWEPALRAMGIQLSADEALPTAVNCPLCQGRLVVLPDTRNGAWVRCSGCKWAGDLIELGKTLWGLDALDALRKFRANGLMFSDTLLSRATADRYEEQVVGYRAAIRTFWETASAHSFQNNAEWRRLHEQFALYSGHDPARWHRQLGVFVGASTAMDAVRAIKMDNSRTLPMAYMFPGVNWKEILVIPSWDMPGRIGGFWFVGRQGRAEDWVYYWTDLFRVRAGWGSPQNEREAGLAFLNPDHIHHSTFGTTWFVVGDPAMALRVHGRYFRDHGDYLPLVLAYEGPEGYARAVWRGLEKRDWVFWAPTATREVFAQARAANGRVCICPFDQVEDLRRLMTWLRRVRTRALPWREALAAQLPQLSDPQLESILGHFEINHIDAWHAFASGFSGETLRRLEACHGRLWPETVVHTGNVRVCQRPDGLFIEHSGELVTDVHMEVVGAVAKKTAGKKTYDYYLIRCRYRDHEWEVALPMRNGRRKLSELLEIYMVEHGLGIPRFSPVWRYRLLDLALRLSKPRDIPIRTVKGRKKAKSEKLSTRVDSPRSEPAPN